MIVAGILQHSGSKLYPYAVKILTGDKEKTNHSITFFLGNEDDVPHHIKEAVKGGEPTAIIVQVNLVDLTDPFAYYTNEIEIEIKL